MELEKNSYGIGKKETSPGITAKVATRKKYFIRDINLIHSNYLG